MAAAARLAVPLRAGLRSARFVPGPLLSGPVYQSSSWQSAHRWFSARGALREKKFTEDHEWIELSSDGRIGTIGITNYAAKALGDVVYVELPQIDLEVEAGDAIGAVESVKSASDIMTPLSGKIVEANAVLEEKPATINKGPETEGWIAKIEIADKSEMDSLMDAEAYSKHTEE